MLKNLLIGLLLIAFGIYLSGCVTYYGSANVGSAMSYVPKPAYTEKDTSAIYISGAYTRSFDGAYSLNDQIDLGQIMLHKGITTKGFNFAYGGMGHFGSYKVDILPEFNSKQSFWGLGSFVEINKTISSEHVDFRLLGARAAVYYEGGEFADYRKVLDTVGMSPTTSGLLVEDIDNLHPHRFTYELAFNTELLIKSEKANMGMRFMMGVINGGAESNITGGINFFLNKDRWTLNTQFGGAVFMEGTMTTFGLNYQIR